MWVESSHRKSIRARHYSRFWKCCDSSWFTRFARIGFVKSNRFTERGFGEGIIRLGTWHYVKYSSIWIKYIHLSIPLTIHSIRSCKRFVKYRIHWLQVFSWKESSRRQTSISRSLRSQELPQLKRNVNPGILKRYSGNRCHYFSLTLALASFPNNYRKQRPTFLQFHRLFLFRHFS